MEAFDELRWALSHDACSPRHRGVEGGAEGGEGETGDDDAPRLLAGAVPVGAAVRVVLAVDQAVSRCVASVAVRVGQAGEAEARLAWRQVAAERCPEGFAARLALDARPHVAFYAFAVRTADGEELLYVPRADGRSTFGELVRDGIDGRWTDAGWRWDDARLPQRNPSDFRLAPPLGGFQITVYDQGFSAPSWLRGAVMYQIFPDRFARGQRGVRAAGLAYHEAMGRPVLLHERWDEPAVWQGACGADAGAAAYDSRGAAAADGAPAKAYDPVDFFGGTLAGIREKLPYLASLGVEVLYLNPCFEARSNHRYDTADYLAIDSLLGTNDEFSQLAQEARGFGIAIVLDAVMSHTGADSRYFNARGAYPEAGAAQGEGSRYYGWFDFTPQDNGVPYRCWWGDATLPEVEERNADWQRFMLGEGAAAAEARAVAAACTCAAAAGGPEGPSNAPTHEAGTFGVAAAFGRTDRAAADATCAPEGPAAPFEGAAGHCAGVLPFWIDRGAAGYRIDVADEIPDDVLERIRASVKGANPQAALIGEVWEDATTKVSYGASRTYALGRALDSVMNYPLRNALLGFALGSVDAQQLAAFVNLQAANYPPAMHGCLMNLLGSHDVERVRSVLALGGQFKQESRAEQARLVAGITADQDVRAARLQQLAAALLYALPGAPCIYYGDEAGLQGGGDPFCRQTFPWGDGVQARRGDCGADLTAFYQRLGRLRRGSNVLRQGAIKALACGDDAICVLRAYDGEVLAVLANRSGEPRRVAIDVLETLPCQAGVDLRDVLPHQAAVDLPDVMPHGTAVDLRTDILCESDACAERSSAQDASCSVVLRVNNAEPASVTLHDAILRTTLAPQSALYCVWQSW